MEDGKDLQESLGASEAAGNLNAISAKEGQLEAAKQAKRNMLQMHDGSGLQSSSEVVGSNVSAKPDPFNSGVDKKEMMSQLSQAKDLEKRIEEDERLRAKEELNKLGDDAHSVILMPKYKKCPRLNVDKETDIPPSNLFIGLGWDEDSTTGRRHYRQFYPDELEHNREIFPTESPFNSYKIYHGVAKGQNDKPKMFSNKRIHQVTDSTEVAKLT